MVSEAKLERTENGLVAKTDGWFVLNARDAPWRSSEDRPAYCLFEGETDFEQIGVHLIALRPGEPMAMYHWESDQENFLVISGEATLVIEGEERPLRQWDFVHCPPEAKHVIVGAGDGNCLVLALGARINTRGEEWGGYTVDGKAAAHGASVDQDTTSPEEAYGHLRPRAVGPYQDGWLPS
jgi:uncharacterized cupin superfamily protein